MLKRAWMKSNRLILSMLFFLFGTCLIASTTYEYPDLRIEYSYHLPLNSYFSTDSFKLSLKRMNSKQLFYFLLHLESEDSALFERFERLSLNPATLLQSPDLIGYFSQLNSRDLKTMERAFRMAQKNIEHNVALNEVEIMNVLYRLVRTGNYSLALKSIMALKMSAIETKKLSSFIRLVADVEKMHHKEFEQAWDKLNLKLSAEQNVKIHKIKINSLLRTRGSMYGSDFDRKMQAYIYADLTSETYCIIESDVFLKWLPYLKSQVVYSLTLRRKIVTYLNEAGDYFTQKLKVNDPRLLLAFSSLEEIPGSGKYRDEWTVDVRPSTVQNLINHKWIARIESFRPFEYLLFKLGMIATEKPRSELAKIYNEGSSKQEKIYLLRDLIGMSIHDNRFLEEIKSLYRKEQDPDLKVLYEQLINQSKAHTNVQFDSCSQALSHAVSRLMP